MMASYEIQCYEPLPLDETRPRYQRSAYGPIYSTESGKGAQREFLARIPGTAWGFWQGDAVTLGIECPGWYEKGRLFVLEKRIELPLEVPGG